MTTSVSSTAPRKHRRGRKLTEEQRTAYREQRKQRDAELREAANAALEDPDYLAAMTRQVSQLDPECNLGAV